MVTTAITASQASVFADMSGLCLYRLMDFFFKSHTNFVIFYRCKQRQTLLVHHTPQSLPANSLWLSLYLLLQWTFFLTDKTRLGNPLVCLCPRNKYFLLSYHFDLTLPLGCLKLHVGYLSKISKSLLGLNSTTTLSSFVLFFQPP